MADVTVHLNGKTVSIPVVGGGSTTPSGGDGVPSHTILMWYGSADAVPDGWAICDGKNGTPDLRGRFVLGASDIYTAGDTGGEEEVALTVEELPNHAHDVPYLNVTNGGTISGTSKFYQTFDPLNTAYTQTGATGDSQAHNNMPPYYVLLYIMKL